MFKGKSFKKFILASAVILGLTSLTGCSSYFVQSTKKFNKTAIDVLNTNQVVQEVLDADFNDFSFLGADFTKTGSEMLDVDISGVAKYNGDQKAVVTMSYDLEENYFRNVKDGKKDLIVDLLELALKNKEMKSFDFMEISDFSQLNDVLANIAEPAKSGFNFDRGIVFYLGNLQFDEQEGTVSFDMKNNNIFVKTYIETILIYNPALKIPMPTPVTRYEYENYIDCNQVKLFVSPQELQNMKNDPKSIIDFFVKYVKINDKNKCKITLINREDLSEKDTSNIDDFEFENGL